MSRAGRRARRQRLAAGEVGPTAFRTPRPSQAEDDRIVALAAERAHWLYVSGSYGWEIEQARRRGQRNRVLRERRLARTSRRAEAA
jgi:hypothetical protein